MWKLASFSLFCFVCLFCSFAKNWTNGICQFLALIPRFMQRTDIDRTDMARGVVVITTAQLHSTKPELRFCTGSNSARSVSEIRHGQDLWEWFQLEIRLNAFLGSTIPQKQSVIIIIIGPWAYVWVQITRWIIRMWW